MKKVSVTIGLPAFNEEQNIAFMLQSLLAQKTKNTSVKNIIVYSDASTDKTNEIVDQMHKKHKIIKLIKGSKRKGKYFRIGRLFALCKTDVLVILDADIALSDKNFIELLATDLILHPKAVMVSAHNLYLRPNGFIARVLYTHFLLGKCILMSMPNQDSAEHFAGPATAYRNDFIKTLKIPIAITDPHFYIYLSAKKINGFRYYTKVATVEYLPATITDMKKILQRSIGKRDDVLEKMFGEKMIREAFFVPRKSKIIGVWKCFLQDPLYTPFAILVRLYVGRMVHPKKVDASPVWEINTSTKKSFTYAK